MQANKKRTYMNERHIYAFLKTQFDNTIVNSLFINIFIAIEAFIIVYYITQPLDAFNSSASKIIRSSTQFLKVG